MPIRPAKRQNDNCFSNNWPSSEILYSVAINRLLPSSRISQKSYGGNSYGSRSEKAKGSSPCHKASFNDKSHHKLLNGAGITLPFELKMSASSITSSSCRETELESTNAERRRRRMEDYFGSLVRQVLAKQESLQNKLIEAIERFEHESLAREKEWRLQELARVSKEHGVLAHERAISAAKDAALLAFLQKALGEQVMITPLQNVPPGSNPIPSASQEELSTLLDHQGGRGGGGDGAAASCRWPKPEVQDLIRIRSNMELQDHQDHNGLKMGVSLWEEISSAMKKLGYDRSAKRCKEKWENINKYFKRVKASNKKRPQDSKTCPYFEQLESLYQKKRQPGKVESCTDSDSSACSLKAEDVLMQMIGQQQEQDQDQDQRLVLETKTSENTNVVMVGMDGI